MLVWVTVARWHFLEKFRFRKADAQKQSTANWTRVRIEQTLLLTNTDYRVDTCVLTVKYVLVLILRTSYYVYRVAQKSKLLYCVNSLLFWATLYMCTADQSVCTSCSRAESTFCLLSTHLVLCWTVFRDCCGTPGEIITLTEWIGNWQANHLPLSEPLSCIRHWALSGLSCRSSQAAASACCSSAAQLGVGHFS